MKTETIKRVTFLFAFLLVVWGFWRLLVQIPDPFDEAIAKPLIWLLPIYFLLKKEGKGLKSIGLNLDHVFPGVYFALLLGIVFTVEALAINFIKYKGFNFSPFFDQNMFIGALILSAITAVTEEIVFRGYIYGRLSYALSNEVKANLYSTVAWILIYLPLAIFDWQLSIPAVLLYGLLVGIFGFGSAFLYSKTKSIIPSIVLHILWAWPIILFR